MFATRVPKEEKAIRTTIEHIITDINNKFYVLCTCSSIVIQNPKNTFITKEIKNMRYQTDRFYKMKVKYPKNTYILKKFKFFKIISQTQKPSKIQPLL